MTKKTTAVTTATTAKADDGLQEPGKPSVLPVAPHEGEKIGRALSRVVISPEARHASIAMAYGSQLFGDQLQPNIVEMTGALADQLAKTDQGDTTAVSRMLAAQAVSLDAIFTELARRSFNNMGQYMDASERYMRLALKAQSASRSTLEALARLHQPREQTVKHVHINDGGQAVVADHFHTHGPGGSNGNSDKQSHAATPASGRAALPSPDAEGLAMPVTGGAREAAMQDARRDQSRRPKRE
jgi:hypothetical protein